MKKRPKSELKELPEKYKCHDQIYILIKDNIYRAEKNFQI